MDDWCKTLVSELEAGRAVSMVTVIEVLGSAPCAPGSKLLVGNDRIWGTIGGGNLEFTATEQARKLGASARRSLLQSLALGPILSQCCGGRVRLLYEHYSARDAAFFADALRAGGRFETQIDPARFSRIHVGRDSGPAIETGPTEGLIGDTWIEPVGRKHPLVAIFGGGHIGAALVQVLSQAPCDLLVVDSRTEVHERLGGLAKVVSAERLEQLDRWWRPGAIAVVLTHSHELDYAWVRQLLGRGDFAWCGLIGSKTKRNRFLRRLRDEGVDEVQIVRLTCPIGLAGLNSKHPGIVAISTAAQILPLLGETPTLTAGSSCGCTSHSL